jgi:hypothetical protein
LWKFIFHLSFAGLNLKPDYKILMMKMIIPSIIATLLMTSSLPGCKKEDTSSQAPSAALNTVTGKVTDTRGNMIQGAEIVTEHTVWYDTHVNGISDAAGKYKINIPAEPAGSWTAKAQVSKSAWGENYVFDLAADKQDPFTAKAGAERNFVWKLSGQRPGNSGYYGAHVDLYQFGVSVPMEEVKLVFTPYPGEPNLADGSPALPIERMVEDVAGTFMVKDVPIGKYQVKAVHGTKTLLLDYRHNSGTPGITKTVVFGKYGHLAATEYNISFWLSE